MATIRGNNTYDSSTLAYFKQSLQVISNAFATFGWIQSDDTGQAVWDATTATLTGTQLTGNVATYTFSGTPSGPALRLGMSMAVSGLTNNAAVFNITGPIVALTSNTFSLAKTNANIAYGADTGTGLVAALAAPPPVSTLIYEVWRMNDSLQTSNPVFLKISYGSGQLSNPQINIAIGNGTTGNGTLTNGGAVFTSAYSGGAGNAGSAGYDCILSGDTNRLAMLMWRNGSYPGVFIIERTHDANGDDTATGVMMQAVWWYNNGGVVLLVPAYMANGGALVVDSVFPGICSNAATTLYNSNVSVFPIQLPMGGLQPPFLGALSAKVNDFTEAEQLSLSVYTGKSCNYIFSGLSNTSLTQRKFGGGTGNNNGVLLRFE